MVVDQIVGKEVVVMEGHQTVEVTLHKEATTQEKSARFVASQDTKPFDAITNLITHISLKKIWWQ